MVSEYEARKLRHDMYREMDGGRAAMFKCVAGLVVVLLLGVIGVSDEPPAAGVSVAANQGASSAEVSVRPVSDRR